MKKILFIIPIFLILLLNFKQNDEITIPNEAIRFRIIASSNSIIDQNAKKVATESLQNKIIELSNAKTIEESRNLIQKNLLNIENTIINSLKEINYFEKVNVKYGLNYFPEKKYKGIKYNEGYYESLTVEIGAAKGDNFWCVLFPPLCMLEAEESTEVEYKFLVKEILDKLFK